VSSPIRILLCSGTDTAIATQLAQRAAKKSGWPCIKWASPTADGDGSHFYLALLDALGVVESAAAVTESWTSTSVVRSISQTLRIKDLTGEFSAVVIDCGEITQFLDDVNDVRALREVAKQALRPELLMDSVGRDLHAEISGAVEALDTVLESFTSESVVRLAVRSGSYPSGEISEVALDCAVLGLHLDYVVVVPAKKKMGKAEVRRLLSDLAQSRSDIRVVHAEDMKAGPSGQQIEHRCSEGVAVGFVRESAEGNRGQYLGEVLASGLNSAELRVGVLDENLVLATPRVRRVLPLPSTLVRCTPIDAGVDATGVHIHFAAEPSLWPESLFAEPELSAGDV
jgi:hypothetical protein